MQFISKEQYDNAQQKVKAFEERQARYETFKKELGARLQEFEKFNFKRKGNRIIFAGYGWDNKKDNDFVIIGESQCTKDDKFNLVIGKLIAVRKALKLNIDDIVEIVEPKNTDSCSNLRITFNGYAMDNKVYEDFVDNLSRVGRLR